MERYAGDARDPDGNSGFLTTWSRRFLEESQWPLSVSNGVFSLHCQMQSRLLGLRSTKIYRSGFKSFYTIQCGRALQGFRDHVKKEI